jgi:hypothetical protein
MAVRMSSEKQIGIQKQYGYGIRNNISMETQLDTDCTGSEYKAYQLMKKQKKKLKHH